MLQYPIYILHMVFGSFWPTYTETHRNMPTQTHTMLHYYHQSTEKLFVLTFIFRKIKHFLALPSKSQCSLPPLVWPKDLAARGLWNSYLKSQAHSDVEEEDVSEYEDNLDVNSECSDSESEFEDGLHSEVCTTRSTTGGLWTSPRASHCSSKRASHTHICLRMDKSNGVHPHWESPPPHTHTHTLSC